MPSLLKIEQMVVIFLPFQKLHVALAVEDVLAQRNKENSTCKTQAKAEYTTSLTS